MNKTLDLACWVTELKFEDIPPSVIKKTKLHILNTLAAREAGRQVLASYSTPPFPDAFIQETVEAIAIDYDDYFFLGHPSYSTVLPALHLAGQVEADGKEILTAIVAGNEAAGRLGAACFLGPLNGQMWSFIHLLGAACSAGKLLGLDAQQLANAIGIALSHPPFPMEEGFFGTDAKLLTAGWPALQGLQAARWAKGGAKGPRYLLEEGSEFFSHFSFHPFLDILGQWGSSWVSEVLSFKKYPGCVYFQSALEAAQKITRPSEIKKLRIAVNLFTFEVDRRAPQDSWDPIAINFSLKNSAALLIYAGALGPEQLSENFLTQNKAALTELAGKIEVRHDPKLTSSMLRRFLGKIEAGRLLAEFSIADLFKLRRALRHRHPQAAASLGPQILWPLLKSRFQRRDFSLRHIDLKSWPMAFPIRFEVEETSGRAYALEADMHTGSAGDPNQETLVLGKLRGVFCRHNPQEAERLINFYFLNDLQRIQELAA